MRLRKRAAATGSGAGAPLRRKMLGTERGGNTEPRCGGRCWNRSNAASCGAGKRRGTGVSRQAFRAEASPSGCGAGLGFPVAVTTCEVCAALEAKRVEYR